MEFKQVFGFGDAEGSALPVDSQCVACIMLSFEVLPTNRKHRLNLVINM